MEPSNPMTMRQMALMKDDVTDSVMSYLNGACDRIGDDAMADVIAVLRHSGGLEKDRISKPPSAARILSRYRRLFRDGPDSDVSRLLLGCALDEPNVFRPGESPRYDHVKGGRDAVSALVGHGVGWIATMPLRFLEMAAERLLMIMGAHADA